MHLVNWPVDVWGKVFSLLHVEYTSIFMSRWFSTSFSPASSWEFQRHKQYHNLRLVCRKFNQVFLAHSGLTTTFAFCQPKASLFMAGLLTWLRKKYQICDLTCHSDSPCLGMLLPQLLVSPLQLRRICFKAASAASVPCISPFTNLQLCQLYAPADGSLDLQTLANLP